MKRNATTTTTRCWLCVYERGHTDRCWQPSSQNNETRQVGLFIVNQGRTFQSHPQATPLNKGLRLRITWGVCNYYGHIVHINLNKTFITLSLLVNKTLDIAQPLDVLLQSNQQKNHDNDMKPTDCSLYSAYSGMNSATCSFTPRSCKYFSNSSCTATSSVSNYKPSPSATCHRQGLYIPEAQCTAPVVSSPLQQSSQARVWHPCNTRYCQR
jgi:hypothetical protein